MDISKIRAQGHLPTLFCSFLYFTTSCMAWMMVGALANWIIPDLGGLSGSRKGLMVAVPVLGRALLAASLRPAGRPRRCEKDSAAGAGADARSALDGLALVGQLSEVLLVGLLLGVAGASFAVALPMASRWYPPHEQGLVLGIAGAGNVGTALSTFLGSWVASSWGWHAAFGIALVPVLVTLALVAFLAQDSPTQPTAKSLADYTARALDRRDRVVLPLLCHHVRRIRGAGGLPGHLLPRPVRSDESPGRGRRHALCPHGLDDPPLAAACRIGTAASSCYLAVSRHRRDDGGRCLPRCGSLYPAPRDGPDAAGDGRRCRVPTGRRGSPGRSA